MLEVIFAGIAVAVLAWALGRRSGLRFRWRLELIALAAAVLVAGFYVVAKRFEVGLGGVTNLSDRFPWGLWIAFDLCGIALAAGGFVLAAAVHIFHIRRFEPVVRPVLLTSFLAYALVALVLVIDLGRPYRFWHPLIMWQPHSVMFEITMCISLYSLVLMVELSPALFEKMGKARLAQAARALAVPMVVAGVILSTLHQSSFGSLFLIIPHKLYPLWYTPFLPLLFLLSSISAGMAVVIAESRLAARLLGRSLPKELGLELGGVLGRFLWIYLAAKLLDAAWRNVWGDLLHPWMGGLWAAELGLGVALPACLLRRASGHGGRGLLAASLLVMGGVILNRLNVCWLGLLPYTGAVYFPSWMEFASTAALGLAGVLAFLSLSRFLPIFPKEVAKE